MRLKRSATTSLAAVAALTIALQVMGRLVAAEAAMDNGENAIYRNQHYQRRQLTTSNLPLGSRLGIIILSKRDTQSALVAAPDDGISSNSWPNESTTIAGQQQLNTDANLSPSSGDNDTDADQLAGQVLDVGLVQAVQFGLFRHSLSVSVILTIAYTIVFIVGIVGNSFVVAIVCKSPRMRTVTNFFIANLAFADILVLLLCLPATLASNLFIPYVLGLFVCKTVSYLQGVAVSASINTMVAVTMDRFLAICFPMDWHMSRRMARWTIACIWLFSLLISLPWALYFTLVPSPHESKYILNYCTEDWPSERIGIIYFVCANLILLYLFPATVIILCYLGIWYKIERRNIPGDRPKGLRIELIMQKSKLKVVKMMMVVVVIFLLSWLPLYLIFARVKLAEDRSSTEDWLITNLMPLAQWLGASNSCINPILYTFFNSKYKREFIDLLRVGFCCKRIERGDCKRMAANGLMTTTTTHPNGAANSPSSIPSGGALKGGRRPPAGIVACSTGTTYIRMDNLRREAERVNRAANKYRSRAAAAENQAQVQAKLSNNEITAQVGAAGSDNRLLGRKRSGTMGAEIKDGPRRARRWLSAGGRLSAAAAVSRRSKQLEGLPHDANKKLRPTNSADRECIANNLCPMASSGVHRHPDGRRQSLATTALLASGTSQRLCSYHRRQVQALGASSASNNPRERRSNRRLLESLGQDKNKKMDKGRRAMMSCGARSLKSNSTNTTRDTESTDLTAGSNYNCANQDSIRCSDATLECGYKRDSGIASSSTCPSRLPALDIGVVSDDASRPPTTSGGSASYSCSSSRDEDAELGYVEGDLLQYDEDEVDDEEDDEVDYDDYGCYYEDEEDVESGGESEEEDDGNLLFGSAHASPSSDSPKANISSQMSWRPRPRSSLDGRQLATTTGGSCKGERSTRTSSLVLQPRAAAATLAQRLGLISAAEAGDSNSNNDAKPNNIEQELEDRKTWSVQQQQMRLQQTSSDVAVSGSSGETSNFAVCSSSTKANQPPSSSPSSCHVYHIRPLSQTLCAVAPNELDETPGLAINEKSSQCKERQRGWLQTASRDSGPQVSGARAYVSRASELMDAHQPTSDDRSTAVVIHSNPITN